MGYNISLFSPEVVQGYHDIAGLVNDLENVARFLISTTIDHAIEYAAAYNGGESNGYAVYAATPEIAYDTPVSSTTSGGGATDSMVANSDLSSPVGDAATDYGANNQESGIEQGDFVVSDGTNGACMTLFCGGTQ
jgi:hypothetical protein